MKEKSFKKKAVVLGITAVLTVGLCCGILINKREYDDAYNVLPLTKSDIKNADKNNADKLMVVAHPDDEFLWGGGHLMDKGYLVVCVTRGKDKVRSKEFKDLVEASGNSPLIMNYPDKVAGRRDNWEKVYNQIENDINLAMKYKNWKLISTYNANGQYGHYHHKMVHNMVTDVYEKEKIKGDLYYFGKYYRKCVIDDHRDELIKMSDKRIEFKNGLKKYYDSQRRVVNNLWHMADYEMWVNYKDNTLDCAEE